MQAQYICLFFVNVYYFFSSTALSIKQGKFDKSPILIYGLNVSELKTFVCSKSGLDIGSAVTMAELGTHMDKLKATVNGK